MNFEDLLEHLREFDLVLDADPTANIRNSEKVFRVMVGGRMYDPMTMNEVVTGERKRAPYWWE